MRGPSGMDTRGLPWVLARVCEKWELFLLLFLRPLGATADTAHGTW